MTSKRMARQIWWRLKWRLRRAWDRLRAPWPIVGECYDRHVDGHSCLQCDGGHAHEWRPWTDAPRWVSSGPGTPVRCRVCGGRKCDAAYCWRRRHDHTHAEAGR